MEKKKGIMGAPRKWVKTTLKSIRIPDEYLKQIKGNVSEFINEAIGEKLKNK